MNKINLLIDHLKIGLNNYEFNSFKTLEEKEGVISANILGMVILGYFGKENELVQKSLELGYIVPRLKHKYFEEIEIQLDQNIGKSVSGFFGEDIQRMSLSDFLIIISREKNLNSEQIIDILTKIKLNS